MGIWKDIKYALNSTIGTKEFTPLNKLIINNFMGGSKTFTNDGTFIVPNDVTEIYITACGAGGNSSRSNAHPCSGGGGGAAIFCKKFTVVPKQSIEITVGINKKTVIGNLITLNKGNTGSYSTGVGVAGGEPGGIGGGRGGDSFTDGKSEGSEGIFGKGGKQYNNNYAGGGGSLGQGGDAQTKNSDPDYKKPGYGGGAGGVQSNYDEDWLLTGGSGIVFITWGSLSPVQHIKFMNSINAIEE